MKDGNVPTLKDCLKMKELGFKQNDCDFYWVRGNEQAFEWELYYCDDVKSSLFNTNNCVSAPTLEEINLPFYIHTKDSTSDRVISELKIDSGSYPMRNAKYHDVWINGVKTTLCQVGKTQTSANARMWIKLQENNLLKDNPHYSLDSKKQEIDNILELNVNGAGEHYYLVEKLNEVIEAVNKLLEK